MRRHLWAIGSSVIAALSVSPPALAVTDIGLLTPWGQIYLYPDESCPTGIYISGYHTAIPTGSYAPSTLSGGKTLFELASQHTCGSEYMYMTIGGFASDPGINWLSSWKCDIGTNWLTPSGNSYEYDSSTGRATWFWFDPLPQWGGSSSTTCTIIHQ